jgi:hypothetical protein
VPLNVDRKLYKATTFVRLAISTEAVYPSCSFTVQQIVRTDAEIENVPRGHAVRIVIVILLTRKRSVSTLWKPD